MSDNTRPFLAQTMAPPLPNWDVDLSSERTAKPKVELSDKTQMQLLSTAFTNELADSYEHRQRLSGCSTNTKVNGSSLDTTITDDHGKLVGKIHTSWGTDDYSRHLVSETTDATGKTVEITLAAAPGGDHDFAMSTTDAYGKPIDKGYVQTAFTPNGDLHMRTDVFNQGGKETELRMTDIYNQSQISGRIENPGGAAVFDSHGTLDSHNWFMSLFKGHYTVKETSTER
jgi:hypothetical protein